MNYENDITIDDSALDIEWLEQPKLMLKYAQYAAQTSMERDILKERVDVVKAELDAEIRTNPEKFGLAKITEGAVFNTILVQKEYQQIMKDYLQSKYEADVAKGAVNAFEHRKNALENLVKLFGQQYFAGPKMPRNLSEERQYREEQQKQVDAGVGMKLKRRNKE
jgi:hypothetical protein